MSGQTKVRLYTLRRESRDRGLREPVIYAPLWGRLRCRMALQNARMHSRWIDNNYLARRVDAVNNNWRKF